ncbi:FAD-dependent oxidoreductase [Leucobacter japonicus]|uniref:FAD-dependent oxidoreductase n=1 Tax=Leucobacter japonicus TaxID=1461259 RepID=UPI000A617ECB|nr:FAD-dependent oxidoreductase [Leucobacter japonicus]
MSAPLHIEHLVIGGGAMGLATTWHLAARGHQVRLLERFEPHHTRGASHGSTRNLNNAYDEAAYLDLFDEAVTLWRRLEAESGQQLLGLHGLVTHGDDHVVASAHDALVARGAAVSLLSASDAAERWSGMRFAGNVLHSREAGIVHAARALAALEDGAIRNGAIVERGERVLDIAPFADGSGARVRTEGPDGVRELTADRVTVTAGAWAHTLLDGVIELPQLTVTEEHPAHFAARSAALVWPSFNHMLPESLLAEYPAPVYGMPSPGEGVKVGFHAVGDIVDPDARRFRASDAQRDTLRRYVAEWFPGLDPETPAEISCTYTSTASSRFVLDTVGPITVGAGFSGHGFKFVPAIGRVLADAASGRQAPPEFFRLSAHR